MMRDQVKAMKGNVGASIKTLGEELEKLHSLWNQFKPRSEIFTSQVIYKNVFDSNLE